MLQIRLDASFRSERDMLFGLAYRMTASVGDAEDVVQDTFARTLANPPEDLERSLAPYLVRIATNLALDRLRARKRRAYVGPWLPEALEIASDVTEVFRAPDARYGQLESVTVAFLVALEALTPAQRAVLLLRDVFDLSVAETADRLAMTETNVKVTHHRARVRMTSYDRERVVPDASTLERTRSALERFVVALLADDVEAMTALLREDAVVVNDGGGEFHAARKPVIGRDLAIRFHRNTRREGIAASTRVAIVNGLPTLIVRYAPSKLGLADRFAFQVEVDARGRIRMLRSWLATPKVDSLAFPDMPI